VKQKVVPNLMTECLCWSPGQRLQWVTRKIVLLSAAISHP